MNGGDDDSYDLEAEPDLEAAADEDWMVEADDGGGVGGGADVGADETSQVPELQLQGPNQLTLFFQGETYIFDSIAPERVQAVISLLREEALPSAAPATVMGTALNLNSGAAEYGSPSLAKLRRQEALIRFREKKKKFCFDKKLKYAVRKEVASRMKRHKGQFVSSKADTNASKADIDASKADTNAVENPPAEKGGQEEIHETSCENCENCGLNKDLTPMMRRGPCGPKSLCNACGLMWANKSDAYSIKELVFIPDPISANLQGRLRKLPQASSSVKQEVSADQNEQSVDNDSGGLVKQEASANQNEQSVDNDSGGLVKQEASSANQNEQSVDNDSGGLSFEWGDISIAPAETGPSWDEK